MEIFALTHVAVDYEDPGPAPQLRKLDDISIPKSAVLGVAGSAAALTVLAGAPDAQAVIQRGDVCDAVGDLQSALVNQAGFNLFVDNSFGPSTESAVRTFQTNRGLVADGVAGPATADALGLAGPGSPFEFGNGCGGSTGGGGTPGTGTSTVTASVLNIRSGPGLGFTVVGELFEGTQVEVLRTSGDWAEISSSTAGEAWVSSSFLAGDGSTGGGGTPSDGTATVTASELNIRSGPGLGFTVIGSLFEGTEVSILGTSGNWTEISSSAAGEAWVSSDFISTNGSGTGGGSGTAISTASGGGANVRAFPDGPRVYGLADGAAVNLNGVTRSVNGLGWSQLTDGNWVASFVLS
ncbi:MAG: SH3 domain-containing protein [Cyanobacteria bacterium P01_A01_bin.135]